MKKLCTCRPRVERDLAPTVGPERARMVAIHSKLWASGTKLRYYIQPTRALNAEDHAVVRESFVRWDGLVGLSIEEVFRRDRAHIRIGFDNDGSWSYVGRDNHGIPADQNTMNFGWSVAEDPDTALHEIGHALGMSHEHQSPHSGITWNRQAVIASLSAPPNSWSFAQIESNVFRKLPANAEGSDWDPNSIMEYPFDAGMITHPDHYRRNALEPLPGLSPNDVVWARKMYPSLIPGDDDLQVDVPQTVTLEPGGQSSFSFVPPLNTLYGIYTKGANDTVLVLFDEDGEFVVGDDDSGKDTNARLEVWLKKGKRYTIRLRMFWSDAGGQVTILATR